MVELLKQGQYQPMHVIDQVLSIYAGTRGHLDDVPLEEVRKWETDFLEFVHIQKTELWNGLDETKDLTDELQKGIEAAIWEFKQQRDALQSKAETAA